MNLIKQYVKRNKVMLLYIFVSSIFSEGSITAIPTKENGKNYLQVTTNNGNVFFKELHFVSNTHQSVAQKEEVVDFTSKFNSNLGNERNKTYTFSLPSYLATNKVYYLDGITTDGQRILTEPYYLNKQKFIPSNQVSDADLTMNSGKNKKSKVTDNTKDDDKKSGSSVATWVVLGVGLLVLVILLLIVWKMCSAT